MAEEDLQNKAAVLLAQGRAAEAIGACGAAICFRPERALPYAYLARALKDLNLPAEERRYYLRALRLDGENAEILQDFGNHFERTDRPDEAASCYKAALCLKPDLVEANANLGTSLRTAGKLQQAAALYERAIALAPRNGGYYRFRANIRQIPVPEPILLAMEDLVKDPSQRLPLHFALGELYERRQEFDRSFSHYAAGNRLKRQSLDYDSVEQISAIEAFAAQGFEGRGDLSNQPVFIVGMPRSGSTLIEQILASHPEVYAAGEREEFGILARKMPEQLAAAYTDAMRALAPDAKRIVDKMPGNFLYAGLIHLALPNAKIIHSRRDPVDTCLSCFSRLFIDDNMPWSYDLAELGQYYRAYDALMAHWRAVLPEGVMLEVQYEEVVADLEGQARRIVAHCGLDWDPRCLSFHETERTVRTASASQVRQKIYQGSVQRGHKYGQHLQPLYDALKLES